MTAQAIRMTPRRLKLAHAIRSARMWLLAKRAHRRHHYERMAASEVAAMVGIYALALLYAAVATGWLAGIESWGFWR